MGGKRDRQIYRIDFTFNLRQKEKGGNSFAVALLPQSAKENKNTCSSKSGQKPCDSVSTYIKHPSSLFHLRCHAQNWFSVFGKYADVLSHESQMRRLIPLFDLDGEYAAGASQLAQQKDWKTGGKS